MKLVKIFVNQMKTGPCTGFGFHLIRKNRPQHNTVMNYRLDNYTGRSRESGSARAR